ncbi:hypothetical protein NDU88_003016 [Pleurodeles waltl]|uniref:Uncharacterized protein n=1 Tax=Pleurodeles waltl TaxID=8319 RepID=A0AAV7RFF0_PLEWA|nr:hypothetical protein NDU88_003016 [Pleurodeles waltl]
MESASPKMPAADLESASPTHAQKQQSHKEEVRQAPGFPLPLNFTQPSNWLRDVHQQHKASAHWKQVFAQRPQRGQWQRHPSKPSRLEGSESRTEVGQAQQGRHPYVLVLSEDRKKNRRNAG